MPIIGIVNRGVGVTVEDAMNDSLPRVTPCACMLEAGRPFVPLGGGIFELSVRMAHIHFVRGFEAQRSASRIQQGRAGNLYGIGLKWLAQINRLPASGVMDRTFNVDGML